MSILEYALDPPRYRSEQVAKQSLDLTTAVLRLPDRSILVVSVYIKGPHKDALSNATNNLHQVIQKTRDRIGSRVGVILAGDFNRHDQLAIGRRCGLLE
jgi:hypothetical protein